MLLKEDDKLLIVHRRLFEKDRARYFIGAVDASEGFLAKVTGYTWIQDVFSGKFIRKEELRTKLIAVSSPGLLVYCLPVDVNLHNLKFETGKAGHIFLQGDHGFKMDLSEGFRSDTE